MGELNIRGKVRIRKPGRLAGALLACGLAIVALARLWGRRSRLPHLGCWESLLAEELGLAPCERIIPHASARYRRLLQVSSPIAHPVLEYHRRFQILPALAMYRALRENGFTENDALSLLERLLWAEIGPLYAPILALLRRLPQPWNLWRGVVRLAMALAFPPAGWRRRPVFDGAARLGFDITGCIYLDTLRRLGASEVAPLFCGMDDRMAGLAPPSIRWERAGTLAMGAPCCDFRWTRAVSPARNGEDSTSSDG